MKITKYSADQFAGIRDGSARFEDGLNVVLGDNESGKSTMIASLFHALTTPAKLDKRKNLDFITHCFPSGGAGTIDAAVSFTEGGREFRLEKIWDIAGEDTQTKLKEADGDLLRGSSAESRLSQLLRYSPAVYDNLVFGRQNREESILKWCYRFFGEKSDPEVDAARQQIASALSAAGGISEEKLFTLLENRLNELAARWDFAADRPEGNRMLNNRWKTGVGTILEKYYLYQLAQEACERAREAEEAAARQTRELARLREEKAAAEQEHRELIEQKGAVDSRSQTAKLLESELANLDAAQKALERWPRLEARLQKGKELASLQQEALLRREQAELKDRLAQIAEAQQIIDGLSARVKQGEGLPEDCEKARKLANLIEKEQAGLTAARLTAAVRLENGHTARLLLADGTVRELSGTEKAEADGYVKLSIPGVAEILVAPRQLDVEAVQEKIGQAEKALGEILFRWSVQSPEDLAPLERRLQADRQSLRLEQQKLDMMLLNGTPDDLFQCLQAIAVTPDLTIPEDLEEQIAVCRGNAPSLEAAVSSLEASLNGLLETYESREALVKKEQTLQASIAAYQKQLEEGAGRIALNAEEYRRQETALQQRLKDLEEEIGNILRQLGSLDNSADMTELESEKDRAKADWQAAKRLYENYARIRDDLEALRAKNEPDDSFALFHEKFNAYLGLMTEGRLSMEEDGELLLHSGKNSLTEELLSAGTRRTLLLAFRLAVLEYFFPEGDGLIVLDDDLLDMDPSRRQKAARLLQQFAQRHQVIFTTCDPAIAALLGGNLIRF